MGVEHSTICISAGGSSRGHWADSVRDEITRKYRRKRYGREKHVLQV